MQYQPAVEPDMLAPISPPPQRHDRANSLTRMVRAKTGGTTPINPANLALEIALYGDDLDRVADSYNISRMLLDHLMSSWPTLKAEMVEAEAAVKQKGRLRMRASDMLESLLQRVAEVAFEEGAAPATVLKAAELVARVADAIPRGPGEAGAGPLLNVTFVSPPAGSVTIQPIYDSATDTGAVIENSPAGKVTDLFTLDEQDEDDV